MANPWTRANPDGKLKTQETQVNGPGIGADDGIRTRDPHLGKVVLYQLSHVRAPLESSKRRSDGHPLRPTPEEPNPPSPLPVSGSSSTATGSTAANGTTKS